MSIRRIVGEPGTLLRSNFHFHGYPTRLGVETVYGKDCSFATASWLPNANGSLVRQTSATGGNVIAQSRRMHAGCRLLAVGLCSSMTTEPFAYIGRQSISTAGVVTTADIAQVGNGSYLVNGGGLEFCGEQDWSLAAALASGANSPYPIWGNGQSYGPMFAADDAVNGPIANDRVILRLVDSGSAWDASTDIIHFVQFIYAY
jgi:hypothetical protein